MPSNEYTPQQALDLLMKKLSERDKELSDQVQAALDVGKDVEEIEPSNDLRKKGRIYRKTAPFRNEEALQIALDALQACFVEQPLFVASAADSFTKAAIGVLQQSELMHYESIDESEPVLLEYQDVEKAMEIEIQSETQLSKTGDETILLKRVSKEQIDVQRQNIAKLRELTSF